MTTATLSEQDTPGLNKIQLSTILVCFLMNILDGMDVLIISYCAPAIAEAWDVSPEALGAVFSAGLAGMTIGALFVAPSADLIGRKTMILLSACLISVTVFITAYSNSILMLILLRLLSGVGIGTMLASTTALASEYAPDKTRDFWVSFMISGYPVGAVLSGLVAADIVPEYGWQVMFKIAAAGSLFTIPLIWFFLSESVQFYLKRQPENALEKANRILAKMNRKTLDALPIPSADTKKIPGSQLLKSEYRLPTIGLWTALFLAFCSLYFLTSWIPKLASNTNLSMSLAIYAGTIFNSGAFIGILTQGYFSSKFGLKKTIGIFLMATAILMLTFRFYVESDWLLVVFGLLGFGIQGGFVGLYAVSARMYPTEFRTTGVGWSIGVGRLGGVIGPALGGILIGAGLAMVGSFMVFAIPTFLAGLTTLFISSKNVS